MDRHGLKRLDCMKGGALFCRWTVKRLEQDCQLFQQGLSRRCATPARVRLLSFSAMSSIEKDYGRSQLDDPDSSPACPSTSDSDLHAFRVWASRLRAGPRT